MVTERCLKLCLCLVCCLSIVCCKEFEFQFCIPKYDFYYILKRECEVTVRNSINDATNLLETKKRAKSFLWGRKFKRTAQDSREPSRGTDYFEECCIEGCRTEEIMEYC